MVSKWQSIVKNDSLVVAILFGMLAVLSVVQIQGIRQATKAAERAEKAAGFTNIITECRTPGTACYEFTRQQDEAESSERRAESFCLLDVIISAPPGPRSAEQAADAKMQYLACVEERTLPDPPTPPTTTTTKD